MKKEDIEQLISQDEYMVKCLRTVRKLNLPDCWISAGFVRAKVWDRLHQFTKRTETDDVDVIYYDPDHVTESFEKQIEQKLHAACPDVPWSVKNQARMHTLNGTDPYESSFDAVSQYPETATAVMVRMTNDGAIEVAAPHGISDLVNCVIKPTPMAKEHPSVQSAYNHRVKHKQWDKRWPQVRIER
ncbi:nucleotidyltransferase family protein [Geomicrobium sp. JCM 19039]|uniref:nucleotidyltransferase family protein n=1 Tax=Geomicrobium sp. JCM 19039 TaxID=1460636 RepID=UPI00045F4497|nr:nucleotidyltransferase family protein [Geomicrobium sp. JCM 19039]GAK14197.1 hypothetical protein JCM19039_4097 [Geomicrobium sp. JCM 19039]